MANAVQTTVSVAVPSVTDPDIGTVDVTLTGLPQSVGVGDIVVGTPLSALPTNAFFVNCYVTAANVVRCVFISDGGNITGAARNFKFHVIYS